jgi:hypothetical protein
MDKKVVWYGFMHGLASVTYVAFVAGFISQAQYLFGANPAPFIVMLFMLTLLVVSAAIMTMLVFGRPAIWYFNGKKAEAVQLALATIGFIILIAVVVFAGIFAILPSFSE